MVINQVGGPQDFESAELPTPQNITDYSGGENFIVFNDVSALGSAYYDCSCYGSDMSFSACLLCLGVCLQMARTALGVNFNSGATTGPYKA